MRLWQDLGLEKIINGLQRQSAIEASVSEALLAMVVNRLVMFDTTSSYFEGRGSAGLAATGYSRDKRPDRVQVIIAVLMTRDGIPVAHYVFPGNTDDINAFRRAFSDLKGRFPLEGAVASGGGVPGPEEQH